jgi:adenylyl-sulfate kinase
VKSVDNARSLAEATLVHIGEFPIAIHGAELVACSQCHAMVAQRVYVQVDEGIVLADTGASFDVSGCGDVIAGFHRCHPDAGASPPRAQASSRNLHWQAFEVDKRSRTTLMQQRPCVVWFTGRPGAGKSTVANLVEKRLHAMGSYTYLIDGDNVRHGLNHDLGFTDRDRAENIRRVAEVARLMADAGLIVLVSCISPFKAQRVMARALMEPGEFVEVFVNTPLAVAEARDPKGSYRKARRGELQNFTGLDSPYEPPDSPEVTLDTVALSAEQAADVVLEALRDVRVIQRPKTSLAHASL